MHILRAYPYEITWKGKVQRVSYSNGACLLKESSKDVCLPLPGSPLGIY